MGVMFQQQVSLSYCSAMMSGSQGRKYLKAQCTHSYHGLWHMLTQPKSTTVHFLSGGYSCGVRLFGGADFLEWCHARTAKQLVAFSQESRCDNGHCLFWATDFLECCLALTPKCLPFSQVSRLDDELYLFWGWVFWNAALLLLPDTCLFLRCRGLMMNFTCFGDGFSGMLPCSYSQTLAFFPGVEAWWWTLLVLGMGFLECCLALTLSLIHISEPTRRA